jgi:hypothetical protein
VNEIDTLYKAFHDLQIIHPNGSLESKPWGMRQFSILDNSGNIISFWSGNRLTNEKIPVHFDEGFSSFHTHFSLPRKSSMAA